MAVKLGNGKWAVKEDKLLAYNDNSGRFFNKEFDFSRGSSATYVAKDGLIKTAGLQATNLVNNGDFATDSNWIKYYAGDNNSVTIANGVLSFNSNTNQNVQQTISSSNLSGFYKITYTITSYTRGNAYFLLGGGSNIYLGSETGTFTKYVQGGGNTNNFVIYGGIYGQGGELSIDNVSVKEIQLDVPRIDFSDSVKGALLLEPQSTNLITYSEDFLSLNIRSNAVVTSNAIVSPSGVLDADEITFDGTYSGRVEQTISSIVGQSYTISLYLKNKNLSDKTQIWIGFSAAAQGSYVTITDEWQRYDITTTANGTNEYPRLQFSGTGSLYAWGFQTEQLSYATSYIPTSGSAVTRNAEVCNNSGSAQDFNDSEGVLYAEISALADDLTFRSIALSDGTLDNRVIIRYRTTTNRINIIVEGSNVLAVNYSQALTNITNYSKFALKYKSGDIALWLDGVEVFTDSTTFTITGLDRLTFDGGSSTDDFYGKVREVQVFTEALTDEQLQKLTT